jgi:hypothetical protein
MRLLIPLVALLLAGCAFGVSPDMLKELKGDGACLGIVGSINQPVYGSGGLGVARLNSPGTITVAKDGTISCTITGAK